ncbi:putative mpv17 / PMP22 family domain-containing protein [Neospora caninum Liverpool]|uniref:Mpv17 / PMP22 family domain-containing protein,putative n=1 Tax=Neospora caninum (strain Liverpool) TaxID=572307 RepID=F0VIT6_NEOCL|nr:putative mpv17 / PMP22 family domain-containing protein [Neospora caninum Liverpool]CBZ53647.1 putative mpv17 / PMP22 family domain-containing protein [Neospora caninum Liverpool]CEL67638.1 TPA: mpv17 / PMP22 family domain-containing protein,putative [Neospora caninum Liverpool]|eukprot:XP_003883679.1 putative mpv17 / PMP22 family domain-containing protein [Neospora caninum Liverpool]
MSIAGWVPRYAPGLTSGRALRSLSCPGPSAVSQSFFCREKPGQGERTDGQRKEAVSQRAYGHHENPGAECLFSRNSPVPAAVASGPRKPVLPRHARRITGTQRTARVCTQEALSEIEIEHRFHLFPGKSFLSRHGARRSALTGDGPLQAFGSPSAPQKPWSFCTHLSGHSRRSRPTRDLSFASASSSAASALRYSWAACWSSSAPPPSFLRRFSSLLSLTEAASQPSRPLHPEIGASVPSSLSRKVGRVGKGNGGRSGIAEVATELPLSRKRNRRHECGASRQNTCFVSCRGSLFFCDDGVAWRNAAASTTHPLTAPLASLRFLHSSALAASARPLPVRENPESGCREDTRGKEEPGASCENPGHDFGAGTEQSAFHGRDRTTRCEGKSQGEGTFGGAKEEGGAKNGNSFRQRLKRPIKDPQQLRKDILFNSIAALTIYAISDTTAQKLQQGLRALAEQGEGKTRDEKGSVDLCSVGTLDGGAAAGSASLSWPASDRETEGRGRQGEDEEARGGGKEDWNLRRDATRGEEKSNNSRDSGTKQEIGGKNEGANDENDLQRDERKKLGDISFWEEWDCRRTASIALEGVLLNGFFLTVFYHKLEVVVHDDALSSGVSEPNTGRTQPPVSSSSAHSASSPSPSCSIARQSSPSLSSKGASPRSPLTVRQRSFYLWRQSLYKVLTGQIAFMPVAAVIFLFLAPVFRAGLFYLFPPAGVSGPAAAIASLPSFAPTSVAQLSPPRHDARAESPLAGLQRGPSATAVVPISSPGGAASARCVTGQPRTVSSSTRPTGQNPREEDRSRTEEAQEEKQFVHGDWFRLACREGILSIGRSFWEVYIASWYVWPLTDLVNFRYIPLRYRPLWDTTIDLFWTVYLSVAAYPRGLEIAARLASQKRGDGDSVGAEPRGALTTLCQAVKILLFDPPQ